MATQNNQNQNAEAEAAAAAAAAQAQRDAAQAQRDAEAAAAAEGGKGKTDDVVKPPPQGRELKIGETLRLTAVHGRIIHPFSLADFDTDRSVKVEVDSWTKLQYEAGKLKIED